jgi:hypothetical protein
MATKIGKFLFDFKLRIKEDIENSGSIFICQYGDLTKGYLISIIDEEPEFLHDRQSGYKHSLKSIKKIAYQVGDFLKNIDNQLTLQTTFNVDIDNSVDPYHQYTYGITLAFLNNNQLLNKTIFDEEAFIVKSFKKEFDTYQEKTGGKARFQKIEKAIIQHHLLTKVELL